MLPALFVVAVAVDVSLTPMTVLVWRKRAAVVSPSSMIFANARMPTLRVSEKLLCKEDAGLYHFINQGCLGVDGMDDREEMRIVDVCKAGNYLFYI